MLKVFGLVQGVSFRYQAIELARDLSLVGWIKNEADGTVEAVAEGNEENLKKFFDWCEQGPDGAKVEKVDVKWQEALEKFSDFKIKY